MNHYFEYSNINQNKFDPCVMQMCSIFIVYNTVHYVLKTLFSWLIYQYKFSIRVNYMHSSEKKIMKATSQTNKELLTAAENIPLNHCSEYQRIKDARRRSRSWIWIAGPANLNEQTLFQFPYKIYSYYTRPIKPATLHTFIAPTYVYIIDTYSYSTL